MLSCSARKIPAVASGVLLVIHVALLGWIASSYSPVVCELTQVPAGVSHLGLGNFDVYRVHPPLVRMLAAVPLILSGARTDWSRLDNSPDHRCEMAVGQDFLAANGEHAFDLFSLARVAAIPFSVLGAVVVGRWAQELYGPRARLMAIALWCFNPTILGNGALVTADVAAGSLAIVSCYQFRKWLMRPSKSNAFLLGIVLGAAQLTKTTLILLYPVFFALQGLAWMRRYGGARGTSWTQVMIVLATSLVVLSGGYSFDGTFITLGEYNFHSSGLRDPETTGASNRFAGRWLARVAVPLPRDYVQGIDLQEFDFEMTKRSYLAGEWKNGGWWYFYLYALFVKEPIGFLLLLTLAGFLCLWRRQSPTTEDLLLVIPAMSFLIFVSSHTGFSIHYRYIFPVIPPLIVWVSRLDRAGLSPVDWIVRVLVVWSMGSALYVFPHELSYFNEFAGGPSCGSRHLLGSSISWGQDLRYFRRWVEDKAGEEPVFLATLSYVNPKWANIDFRLAPTVNKNCNGATWAKMPTGWYAIDVNHLRDTWEPAAGGEGGEAAPNFGDVGYSAYSRLEPVASVGYSIKVFHLQHANAAPESDRMSEPKKPLPADESSVTSLSMLKGVWAKNPTAWDLLVTKYGITVYSWCRQRGLGEHDAQDVCQEVFASVARKFDEYQQKTQSGGLKNWLYVITRNKLTDYWRLNQRREQARGGSSWQVFLGCIADPLEGSSAIGLGATNGQLAKIVDRVRCESSDQDWQIFSRTVIHGETAQEVARAHGVNVNVVYLAKSRVLKRLRETCKVLLSGG